MSEDFRKFLSGDPYNDAALWHQRLQRSDADESIWLAFTEWLETDARHRSAYGQVEALYEELDELDVDADMAFAAHPVAVRPRPISRRPAWTVGGGLALLAASLLIAFTLRPTSPVIERIISATGETRRVTAADGSVLDLNGGTSIEIAFSSRERRVTLERGEVLFHVAADKQRPFIVLTDRQEIRDIGTVFDIVRAGGHLTVSVEQGKISVSEQGKSQPLVMSAGDRLDQTDGAEPVIRSVDPTSVASWQNGYLVYEDAPMSQIVADVSRYGAREIVLQGPESSFRRFSGVLKIDTQDAMLRRLGQLMPLAIDRDGDGPVKVRTTPQVK